MEINIRFNEDKFPLYVLFFITVKALYVAFMSFFMDVSTTIPEDIFSSYFITDNYLWIPMLIFFVYFYLYRKGKMSDVGLKYSIFAALVSIVPKMALFVVSIYLGVHKSSWEKIFCVIELVSWFLIFMYLVSFWYGKLKLKEHHHHHHHSSRHHHHHLER